MTSPTPSKHSPRQPTLLRLATQSHHTLTHLTRLLSTTAHLDTFLLTLSYTLHFLHASLSRPPFTRHLRLTASLAPLAGLLDEYRTLLRLFGLLGIYQLAVKTYLKGGGVLTWAQIASLTVFQAAENATLLAGRRVWRWSAERVGWWGKLSVRAWAVYVALEFVRLGREYRDFHNELGGHQRVDGGEKSGSFEVRELTKEEMGVEKQVVVREEERREWWRKIGVNAAYAPMTVHYSVEGEGPLGEGSIGFLGVCVAWLSFGKAWRECA